MEAFQYSGYLRGDVDFSRGIEGGEPLNNLLTRQWDVRYDLGHPIPTAPGIFLENRSASTAGTARIADRLGFSSLPALLELANVLEGLGLGGSFHCIICRSKRETFTPSLVRRSQVQRTSSSAASRMRLRKHASTRSVVRTDSHPVSECETLPPDCQSSHNQVHRCYGKRDPITSQLCFSRRLRAARTSLNQPSPILGLRRRPSRRERSNESRGRGKAAKLREAPLRSTNEMRETSTTPPRSSSSILRPIVAEIRP
jgi:hypothetical protein